jgi:hypothetical protein
MTPLHAGWRDSGLLPSAARSVCDSLILQRYDGLKLWQCDEPTPE